MDGQAQRDDDGSAFFAGLLIVTLGQALAVKVFTGSNIYFTILCVLSLLSLGGFSFAHSLRLWRSLREGMTH